MQHSRCVSPGWREGKDYLLRPAGNTLCHAAQEAAGRLSCQDRCWFTFSVLSTRTAEVFPLSTWTNAPTLMSQKCNFDVTSTFTLQKPQAQHSTKGYNYHFRKKKKKLIWCALRLWQLPGSCEMSVKETLRTNTEVFGFCLPILKRRIGAKLKQWVEKSTVKWGDKVITKQFVMFFRAGKCGNSSCFADKWELKPLQKRSEHTYPGTTPTGRSWVPPLFLKTISYEQLKSALRHNSPLLLSPISLTGLTCAQYPQNSVRRKM